MKIITQMEAMVGKTIKNAVSVHYDDSLCLVFTDNTYAVMTVDTGSLGDMPVIELDTCISNKGKLTAGIITEQEYSEIKRKALKEYNERVKETDLRQLKRLQEKYKGELK